MSRPWDGCPLIRLACMGLVAEDKPTKLSYTLYTHASIQFTLHNVLHGTNRYDSELCNV